MPLFYTILVMDPAFHCIEWEVYLGNDQFCPCWDCHLDDLQELPYATDIPCPLDNHEAFLFTMVEQCDKAYSVLLRLESIAATQPDLVNVRILPRIIKRQLLFASLAIYDCGFVTYNGPQECTCDQLHAAKQSLKRLHDVCLVGGYDTHVIWSFLHYLPRPIHSIFY